MSRRPALVSKIVWIDLDLQEEIDVAYLVHRARWLRTALALAVYLRLDTGLSADGDRPILRVVTDATAASCRVSP